MFPYCNEECRRDSDAVDAVDAEHGRVFVFYKVEKVKKLQFRVKMESQWKSDSCTDGS